MTFRHCVIVVLTIIFITGIHGQDLFLDSPCKLKDGSSGICKAIGGCQTARDDLKKGIRPKVCYYDKNLPIICCKSQSGNTPSPGKSWQKCQEYAKAVYVEGPSVGLSAVSSTDRRDTCAQSRHGLIVNGVKSERDEYPHMVALGYGNNANNIDWQCGGSLISEQFVLTAAHCLGSKSNPVRWARLGDLNLANQRDDKNAQQLEIVERVSHPSYKGSAKYDDIALLRLQRGVVFNPSVRPACILTNNSLPDGKIVIATGWGKLDWTNDNGSDDLMKVDLHVVSNRDCNVKFAAVSQTAVLRRGITDQSMFCAGDAKNMRDTCSGDSGGPLQTILDTPYCMYSIVGITSFGSPACGEFGTPAIYTRVSNYVSWIEGIVWP